jgi:hypothetical protein
MCYTLLKPYRCSKLVHLLPSSYFHPSLIFAGKARSRAKNVRRNPLYSKGRLLPLPPNFKLTMKGQTMTNAPAYYPAGNSLIVKVPGLLSQYLSINMGRYGLSLSLFVLSNYSCIQQFMRSRTNVIKLFTSVIYACL